MIAGSNSLWEKKSFLKYDYIIAGSGILGLSTAVSLKERHPDSKILIVERGAMPLGASTRNAGFACFGSLTEILADIGRIGEMKTASLVEKRWKGIGMLRKRIGDENLCLENNGGYELIGEQQSAATDKIDQVNSVVRHIFGSDAFSLANDKITQFGFEKNSVRSLVFSPFESQIDTGKMMNSLIGLALSLGVRINFGYDALIDQVSEAAVRIASHNGAGYFETEKLIICTNAFTSLLLPGSGIKPGRGQVLVTKPVEGLPFRGVFHFDEGYYYFRDYGDRVILGGGRNIDFEEEETFEFGNTQKITCALLQMLKDVILPHKEFEIDFTWSGIMGFNESKLPEVRKHGSNIYSGFCCNGMGVALASYVAEELSCLAVE